ncbi:MAG: pyruvate dehydrogenase (acetyl-transferring) E1 component subunit alpha [Pseudomonadota bacterium]|nr:pyruvate dehydrogenase (acetyl-transferring) E1 component subunit alpha [Pseudomonadota bacterium]
MTKKSAKLSAKEVKSKQTAKMTATEVKRYLKVYRQMLFFRRFEERVHIAYTQGKFSGFCHLHIGQEAVCAGVQAALRDSDYVISAYRSHTQAIAKGIPAVQVMAEMFGKATGCCRGKGGSMHMFSAERRFFGGHGIVGGQVPLAIGMAFKINYRQEDDIVVCYLGDAAINQGQVLEALNMAAIWDLPVLFIVENNRYGMGTDIKRTTAIKHIYQRAQGFGVAAADMDGMNVRTVLKQTAAIVKRMRQDKKPYLLEALTYRYRGHSVSDPANYRPEGELQEFQQLDPLIQLRDDLLAVGVEAEQLQADVDAVKTELRVIEKQADAAELAPVAAIYEDVLVAIDGHEEH